MPVLVDNVGPGAGGGAACAEDSGPGSLPGPRLTPGANDPVPRCDGRSRSGGVVPAFNLKVIVDTEEELGMEPLSEDLVYEMGATRVP